MNKNEQKKQVLTEKLGMFVLENGIQAATLRSLAKAANTSDRMLLHYFKDKEELMTNILTGISNEFIKRLNDGEKRKIPTKDILPYLYGLIQNSAFKPYMNIWIELLSYSSRKEEPYLSVSHQICDSYIKWIEEIILIDEKDDKEKIAAFIFASLEGIVLLEGLGYQTKISQAIEGFELCMGKH